MDHPVQSPRRAFTLMEVMIVIAILVILVGIVAGTFMMQKRDADASTQLIQIELIDGTMDQFYLDMGRYPTEEEGLEVLWSKEALQDIEEEDLWKGPYLEDPIREDNWGSEFVYYRPSQLLNNDSDDSYDIISPGPDREEGTEDDITNHEKRRGEDGEIEEDFSTGGDFSNAGGGQ